MEMEDDAGKCEAVFFKIISYENHSITLLLLWLFNFNGRAQVQDSTFDPTASSIFNDFSIKQFIIKEDAKGRPVYYWNPNNLRITGYIKIMNETDYSTSEVYQEEMKGKLVNGLQQGKWIYGNPHKRRD